MKTTLVLASACTLIGCARTTHRTSYTHSPRHQAAAELVRQLREGVSEHLPKAASVPLYNDDLKAKVAGVLHQLVHQWARKRDFSVEREHTQLVQAIRLANLEAEINAEIAMKLVGVAYRRKVRSAYPVMVGIANTTHHGRFAKGLLAMLERVRPKGWLLPLLRWVDPTVLGTDGLATNIAQEVAGRDWGLDASPSTAGALPEAKRRAAAYLKRRLKEDPERPAAASPESGKKAAIREVGMRD